MIILIGFKKKGRSWYLLKKHEIYLGFGMRKDEGLRNFASSLGELKTVYLTPCYLGRFCFLY